MKCTKVKSKLSAYRLKKGSSMISNAKVVHNWKKSLPDSSVAVAKDMPSPESANWFSVDILRKNKYGQAFKLSSNGEDEILFSTASSDAEDMETAAVTCSPNQGNIVNAETKKYLPVAFNVQM
jgi:hypothetical protein